MPVALKKRARWELQDIFRMHADAYRKRHRLSPMQSKVINAITVCRTSALGGHMERCDHCSYARPVYNSCRNRHCPKCQMMAKAKWLEARRQELLPVPSFHVVFTLPHEVNPLAWVNKKVVYDLLFESVSKTLSTFGKQNLKGILGMTCILHTWDQTMGDHLHIHCAIPAFALRAPQGRPAGVRPRDNFLFPVKALSRVFRGKFLSSLKKANLKFIGRAQDLKDKQKFKMFINELYQKEFVVYSKPSFPGAAAVMDYIGRYTHRVAISNNRIIDVTDHEVTFTYQDRKSNQNKTMTLPVDEFIRRFLLHTLPHSFMRIRHYGFLANRRKKKNLGLCRQILGVKGETQAQKTTLELLKSLTGLDLEKCPCCHDGRMVKAEDIAPLRIDSS